MFVRRGSHRDRVRPYIYPYTEGTWLSLVLELFFKGDQSDLAIVTPAMHPTVQIYELPALSPNKLEAIFNFHKISGGNSSSIAKKKLE